MKRGQVRGGRPQVPVAPDRRVRPSTAADEPAVRTLLETSGLPVEDLGTAPALGFWIAEEGGQLIGMIGLERHGSAGLLRSLVVSPGHRRQGLGRDLVATLEREARAAGVQLLVLLTQTAVAFFERLGYEVIDRALAPDRLKRSAEFRSLCPASALCLIKQLHDSDVGEPHG
jgi:N-acetylglutamate synthase-like GNAT family acetyltransferase